MDVMIILVIGLIIYFAPAINASSRHHPNAGAILLLNLFLGWTLVGWVIALVWSATGAPNAAPSPSSHVKCPDCAELILKEAKVCKHCGCKLVPQIQS